MPISRIVQFHTLLLCLMPVVVVFAQTPPTTDAPLATELVCKPQKPCVLRLPAGRVSKEIYATRDLPLVTVSNPSTGGQDVIYLPDLSCIPEEPLYLTAILESGEILEISVRCDPAASGSIFRVEPLPTPPVPAQTIASTSEAPRLRALEPKRVVLDVATPASTPPPLTAPIPLCEEPRPEIVDPFLWKVRSVKASRGLRCSALATGENLYLACAGSTKLQPPAVEIAGQPYLPDQEQTSDTSWRLRLPNVAKIQLTFGDLKATL